MWLLCVVVLQTLGNEFNFEYTCNAVNWLLLICVWGLILKTCTIYVIYQIFKFSFTWIAHSVQLPEAQLWTQFCLLRDLLFECSKESER